MTTGSGEGSQALPPYPHYHSGPCLVVGNAACLPDDIEKARRLFPEAPCIAVNGAAAEVKAFALYSYHPERFITHRWLEGARKVAGMMGFSPVILVGCPLTPGPYVNGSSIGGLMHRPDVADDMLNGISGDTAWHAGCLSMSGRTRQILGGP
jgi:hypothetical protein